MLPPLRSMLLASLSLTVGSLSATAAPVAEPSSDRLAQIYMGDTPMATTYGRGFAWAPADLAMLDYNFSRYSYSSMSPAPETADVLVFTDADREAIEAAFVAAGVAPENIDTTLISYEMTIRIEIDDPDQAKLNRLDELAKDLADPERRIFLNRSHRSCSLSDFTQIENEARINAITESRSRIDAMAEALGVEVGSILSAIEVHGYAPVSSSCMPPEGGAGTPEVTIEQGVVTTFELIR